jgi:predicted ATPase
VLVDCVLLGWCCCGVAANSAFVGRRDELAAVTGVLTGAADAVAIVVTGEAGVGKSRLVAAVVADAAQASVTTLTGWCLPLSHGLPFLPVVDVLRGLGEIDGGRLLNSLLGDCPAFVRGELIRLMPDLDESGGQTGPPQPDDGWRRQRLFDALRLLLFALAKVRRVAVVVEDLHWADHTTLEFLGYLLAPGRTPGAALVLTCRTEDDSTQALTDWLQRVYRDPRVRRLDLSGLTRVETAEQIAQLLGRPAPRQFADDIYRRSEGNAFFTEQLVAFDRTDGESPTTRHEMPAGLTALLLSRTAEVTGAARDVMDVLAVAARPMEESDLAQICQTDEADVRAGLRELLSARLLRRPDNAGRYQLRHALLSEAVSGELFARGTVRATRPSRRADGRLAGCRTRRRGRRAFPAGQRAEGGAALASDCGSGSRRGVRVERGGRALASRDRPVG